MVEITPRYVLENGEYHEVSEYAALAPSARPVVCCPQCKEEVTLKLGEIKSYHFAHKPDSQCNWNPETIEHLNAKLDLARLMEKMRTMKAAISCFACATYSILSENVITGWDRVEVEFTFGRYRADLALLNGNDLICVIEILVTHECTPDKIKYMNAYGIPWIEIDANDIKNMAKTDHQNVILFAKRYGQFDIQSGKCQSCIERDAELRMMRIKYLEQEKIEKRQEELMRIERLKQQRIKELQQQRELWLKKLQEKIDRVGTAINLPFDFVEVIRYYKPALSMVQDQTDNECAIYLKELWEESLEMEQKSLLDDPWWKFRRDSVKDKSNS